MKIVGLDSLIFGVDDFEGSAQFLRDYGLVEKKLAGGAAFEALDGTSVAIYDSKATDLPAPPNAACMLRKTVLGVDAVHTLDLIERELSKDREVRRLADGTIESIDDSGFVLGFQVTVRRPIDAPAERVNAPNGHNGRPVNELGVSADKEVRPHTLSHVVYFVPDVVKAEAFYRDRLGFRCTDRFEGAGPFLQPGGTLDHHTHFLIGAPAHMQGVEHFTFHFAGPTDVILNGTRFVEKGYQPFWGPGRHIFGSNWFWYFNSPFACHIEMDADMDLHDQNWNARVGGLSADNSQAFLLRTQKKWFPGPGAPKNGAYA